MIFFANDRRDLDRTGHSTVGCVYGITDRIGNYVSFSQFAHLYDKYNSVVVKDLWSEDKDKDFP